MVRASKVGGGGMGRAGKVEGGGRDGKTKR